MEQHPSGLSATEDGYTLAAAPAAPGEFTFQITGPDGAPVTDYQPQHERELHLIAVRRDLSGYRHLHPERDAEGTWHVATPFAEPGDYRVFADFAPAGGRPLTLGLDIHTPTRPATHRPTDTPTRPATHHPADIPGHQAAHGPSDASGPGVAVGTDDDPAEGYAVTLKGDLVAGEGVPLTFVVQRNGEPVTDLEPYLSAYGHLVALRASDLAYLHIHPQGEPGDGVTPAGPEITFHAVAPSPGSYRLYLDYKHHGRVRTAEFTAHAAQPPARS